MATVTNNMRLLESILIKKLRAGVQTAVDETAEIYKEKLDVQEPGPPFRGPHARRIYEYPRRETGQGQDNVSSGTQGLTGRAGVKDAFRGSGPRPPHKIPGGFHLEWLRRRGWLGIDTAFIENKGRIAAKTKAAMKR